ncbi:Molybdopterin synthase catalytic subunit 1 [Emticicia aquatica]|jgi:molybdopterin synthase catalytic subunit|uniref:Molybdopterin synthase catalytic subunit n=1 Tax=Emticicia aquatica TaxID=1681835 RepID=A0ABM9ARX0_9BACT|nr:molybdenum cofactor biosynthesis protein MoaE [Emticicia aquatica]CAH0996644.1 Molybdopterin synthase catalytic subunit 1 [Emticicia aquatica]
MQNIDIILSDKTLNEQACLDFVKTDDSGGIVTFVGTVRNQTKGKKVVRLDFEAYEPMAVSEMRKIAERAIEAFSLKKIAIYHRIGQLTIGEVPVIIAVSAAHRGAAFDACEFAIDTLKETVPIWKKEIFEDGEVWVSATP